MDIQVNRANLPFLECFGSETRLHMIELLNTRPMNIKELAAALHVSSSIVTKHVQKLEQAGIIATESQAGERGRQKVCRLLLNSATLQIKQSTKPVTKGYAVSIPIGQYSDYQVQPTCGLASEHQLLGMVDDPRYFSDPQHVKANHLWFASGYVEYRIPNYIVGQQAIDSIHISLELCSEAPGYNENWPSDITFSINGHAVAMWTCPGDFGSKPGVYTPSWWTMGTKYGVLKSMTIKSDGTYMDGVKMSEFRPENLNIAVGEDIILRIECPVNAEHCGGVNLFGKHFGNYNQDIEINVNIAE